MLRYSSRISRPRLIAHGERSQAVISSSSRLRTNGALGRSPAVSNNMLVGSASETIASFLSSEYLHIFLTCPNLQHLKHWTGRASSSLTLADVQPIRTLPSVATLMAAANGHLTHTELRPLNILRMSPTLTSAGLQSPETETTFLQSQQCHRCSRSAILPWLWVSKCVPRLSMFL